MNNTTENNSQDPPNDYGDLQAVVDIIIDNQVGVPLYVQESVSDDPGPMWVNLYNQANEEVALSPNCMPENCADGTDFDCDEDLTPEAVQIADGDFHIFPWDGIYYQEDTTEECTEVVELADENFNVELCFSQGEQDGIIDEPTTQCDMLPETINPNQPAQFGVVIEPEQ